jgi:hypothetical protein
MSQLANIRLAYAEAYAIKQEAGGGYRGVAQNKLTGEVLRGEQRDTIEAARNDAKRIVWAWADGRNMVTGTYKSPKGSWKGM